MPETDPNLAAIKQREQSVKDAIRRGEREVETGSFGASQLGLSFAVCDEWGRIWRADGTKLVLVYSPTDPRHRPVFFGWDLAADAHKGGKSGGG